jgi:hypothetical protein
MRATKLAFPLLAAGVLLSASAVEVEAQSYTQTVWDQLQRAYTRVNQDDYRLRNYILGRLNDSDTDSWSFHLSAGTTYMVIGACDQDCSDIDMAVKDEDGEVVASDYANDDYPVMVFTPTSSGRFTIDTSMYDCGASYCYFGFGIFEQ